MSGFTLAPQAVDDIERIGGSGLRRFGPAQTRLFIERLFDLFGLLAAMPGLGRPRDGSRVRTFPYPPYVVLFSRTPDGIIVSRVLDARSADYADML